MSRSTLTVRYSSDHEGGGILLVGPPHKEDIARVQLQETIYEILRECEYLDDSQRAAYWAEKLESETPYQHSKRGSKYANAVRIYVSVDIMYSNPPGPWKWWARIRTDRTGEIENTVSPGAVG